MKMECDIVKDLLPLYVEGMVSEKSSEAVKEHLLECRECRDTYEKMKFPEPKVEFETKPGESFKKYVKKRKMRFGWKVALITVLVVISLVMIWLLLMGGAMAVLMLAMKFSPIKMDTDVSHYNQYMGETAKEDYRTKWGMDESIFPEKMEEWMDVKDYAMVYYNPWDAQYLSYLVVEYEKDDYQKEVERLGSCPQKEYMGYYGAKGFDERYDLLAMYSDPYYGFVYALTDGEDEIVYVELIFCNYIMDLNYYEYIEKKYLPIGFDASEDNLYRKEHLWNDDYMLYGTEEEVID